MSLLEDLKMLLAFSPLFRNPDGSIPEGHGGKAWQPREPWCKKYKRESAPPKVGQGGTLDPLASGVLVIGIGHGTKSLQGYLDCAKTYTSVGLLGASTTSYDVTDPIMHRVNHSHVSPELITSLLPYFTGPLLQYPPLYSAVKIDGKRLFDYARSNTPLPRPIEAREIEVTELDLVEFLKAEDHEFTPPDCELPEEEKKLVGRVKELAGQKEGDGDTVVGRKDELESERERVRGAAEAPKASEAETETAPLPSVNDTEAAAAKTTDSDSTANTEANDGGDAAGAAAEATNSAATPAPAAEATTSAAAAAAAATPSAAFTEADIPAAAFRLRMTVSSGTYVRSIIHDVGLACESAAHVVELRRTRQGEWFTHDDQRGVTESAADDTKANVLPWSLFADALEELRVEKSPNAMKVDGQDRELREWEKKLLESLKPV